MMPPVISLLVAGSVQFAAEVRTPEDLVLTVVEAVPGAMGASFEASVPEVPGPSDPPRAALPEVRVPSRSAPLVTYDWRSPVVFDVP